jgi:L-threonylcarbamoyladenylate synthase
LIRSANVPVAAPSANQFGHISPSLAQHVAKDFKSFNLTEQCQNFHQEKLYLLDAGACRVGIESTVCKVALTSDDDNSLELSVLRRGFISINDIERVLKKHGEKFKALCQGKYYDMLQKAKFTVIDRLETFKNKSEEIQTISNNTIQPLISPGNLLSHYAPSYSTFLLSRCKESSVNYKISIRNESNVETLLNLSNCILIDSFQKFTDISHLFGKYLSLCDASQDSKKKESDIMQQNLFHQLHEAEDIACRLQKKSNESFFICITNFYEEARSLGEGVVAVYDRVFRYTTMFDSFQF